MIGDFRKMKEIVMDVEDEKAENKKFYGLNRRTFGGHSETKPATAEVATIRNR